MNVLRNKPEPTHIVLEDVMQKLNEIKRELQNCAKLKDKHVNSSYEIVKLAKSEIRSYYTDNVKPFMAMLKAIRSGDKWSGKEQHLITISENINNFLAREKTITHGSSLSDLQALHEQCKDGVEKQNAKIYTDVITSIGNVINSTKSILENVNTKVERGKYKIKTRKGFIN